MLPSRAKVLTVSFQFLFSHFPFERTLNNNLPSTFGKQYELRLAASDNLKENYTTVVIHVKDVNDNPPVFERPTYRTQITEEDDRNLPKRVLQVQIDCANFSRFFIMFWRCAVVCCLPRNNLVYSALAVFCPRVLLIYFYCYCHYCLHYILCRMESFFRFQRMILFRFIESCSLRTPDLCAPADPADGEKEFLDSLFRCLAEKKSLRLIARRQDNLH